MEIVPLTDQEVADLAEAQNAYFRAIPRQGEEPDEFALVRGAQTFTMTLNPMLEAHGFELYTGTIQQGPDGKLVLRAVRSSG